MTSIRACTCKYGFNCTRLDCFYDHPQGRNIDSLTAGNASQHSGIACRYGSRCTKPNCPFLHPSHSAYPHQSTTPLHHAASPSVVGHSTPSGSARASSKCPNIWNGTDSRPARCRFGLACRYRSTCRFEHPDDLRSSSSSWATLVSIWLRQVSAACGCLLPVQTHATTVLTQAS